MTFFSCVLCDCIHPNAKSQNLSCDLITSDRYMLKMRLVTLEIRRIETLLVDAVTFVYCRTNADLVLETATGLF